MKLKHNQIITKLYEEIIERVGVGIHAVNNEGKTIIYNHKMREMEAMNKEDVLDKNVRDVFKFQENQSSTLLQSLKEGHDREILYYRNKLQHLTVDNLLQKQKDRSAERPGYILHLFHGPAGSGIQTRQMPHLPYGSDSGKKNE